MLSSTPPVDPPDPEPGPEKLGVKPEIEIRPPVVKSTPEPWPDLLEPKTDLILSALTAEAASRIDVTFSVIEA